MLLFFPDEPMADDTQELPLEPAGGRGAESPKPAAFSPLAARMRPRALSEVVGHANILGEGCLLPRLVAADNFGSLIFYGPPGCGKTTLANVIAAQTRSRFVKINAVLSNAAQLRDELAAARYRRGERTILFVDEIHRFNKAQQDLLLPDVEEGNVRLIGATTQNPGFFVNAPLLSRSHLFRLEPLGADDVAKVLRRALDDCERGMGNFGCRASDEILKAVAEMCDGDMRRALNALETMVLAAGGGAELSRADVGAFAKERRIRYDSGGDEHYDTASAFIKSVRGCDPDAAVYWLARMLCRRRGPEVYRPQARDFSERRRGAGGLARAARGERRLRRLRARRAARVRAQPRPRRDFSRYRPQEQFRHDGARRRKGGHRKEPRAAGARPFAGLTHGVQPLARQRRGIRLQP